MSSKFKKGEIATILTIGTVIFLGAATLISSVFLKDKQTTQSKAAGVVVKCQDNPVAPPQGYIWKADCNKSCQSNTDCPKNNNDINVNPDTSNWCFGFDGDKKTSEDWRCLQLKFVGSSVSATNPTIPGGSGGGGGGQPPAGGGAATTGCPEQNKDITGACNYACCDPTNPICPAGQTCSIANGYCKYKYSCGKNSLPSTSKPSSTNCSEKTKDQCIGDCAWYVYCSKCAARETTNSDVCPGNPCRDKCEEEYPSSSYHISGTYHATNYKVGAYECQQKKDYHMCYYFYSSPNIYNSEGQRCYCWDDWSCDTLDKPAGCDCCNDELSPTPTPTISILSDSCTPKEQCLKIMNESASGSGYCKPCTNDTNGLYMWISFITPPPTPTPTPTSTNTPIPKATDTPIPTSMSTPEYKQKIVREVVNKKLEGTFSYWVCPENTNDIDVQCKNATVFNSYYENKTEWNETAQKTEDVVYIYVRYLSIWLNDYQVCLISEANMNYHFCVPFIK